MDTIRFKSAVNSTLTEAGWLPGRDVSGSVNEWLQRLCSHGRFQSSPAAIVALKEFGGIHVRQHGAGVECAREPFQINPLAGEGYEAEFARVGQVVDDDVFPLGDVGGGQAFLLIGRTGKVYYVTERIGLLGRDIDETLTRLIEGRWPLHTWCVDVTNPPS